MMSELTQYASILPAPNPTRWQSPQIGRIRCDTIILLLTATNRLQLLAIVVNEFSVAHIFVAFLFGVFVHVVLVVRAVHRTIWARIGVRRPIRMPVRLIVRVLSGVHFDALIVVVAGLCWLTADAFECHKLGRHVIAVVDCSLFRYSRLSK